MVGVRHGLSAPPLLSRFMITDTSANWRAVQDNPYNLRISLYSRAYLCSTCRKFAPLRARMAPMTDSPARPPEAELVRRARRRQRISIRQAAAAADISESRLRQIEAGYQTVTKGVQIPTLASDVTLAHLAKAYDVTPDELEDARRPDAAEVLREIIRTALPRPVLVPSLPPAGRLAEWLATATDEMIAVRVAHDEVAWKVWNLPGGDGRLLSREKRLALLAVVWADGSPEAGERREGNAGLTPCNPIRPSVNGIDAKIQFPTVETAE